MNANVIFHFSFPGGAGLFPLLLGKGYAFRTYILKKIPNARIFYSGISSGSFVALLLALNIREDEIDKLMKIYFIKPMENSWYLIEQCHMWYFLKKILRILVDEKSVNKLNGTFRVGITKLTGQFKLKTVIVDHFANKEEVINAVLTSCHLTLLGRHPLKYFRKNFAMDGGITCDHVETNDLHLPTFLSAKTITFRIGYDNFPIHLLSYSQAMPLLTQSKWNRMKEEGKICFEQHVTLQLDEFFSTWFSKIQIESPLKSTDKKIEILNFQPQFQKKKFFSEEESVGKIYQADQIIRGLATGWIEVIAGYLVWSLVFTWKFILNRPF